MSDSILVTGGAGYIGAHTCKALARAGYQPIAFDNLSRGHRDFVRWGPLILDDIRDHDAVVRACRAYDVRAVIHFAAFAYVGESVANPLMYYDNNVCGTVSLLTALKAARVENIIFSSTCAVYGNPERLPISEDAPLRPISPYGTSKALAEQILADSARAHGFRYIILRYFNACGADPDGEIGELRDPESHLIPRAMMSEQGYIDNLCIFGTDFETPDGTAIRDYIHVSDVANAHVDALRRILDDLTVGIFNLGTGRGYSVREVFQMIERVIERPLSVVYAGRRLGDPAALIADASRARRELKIETRYSDLETIVRSAWQWHQQAHPQTSRNNRSTDGR